MCGRKKRDALTPIRPPSIPTSRISGRRTPSSNQSTEGTGSWTTDSSSRDVSKASTSSSQPSLTSLRESLPEKPQIYPFPEICRATNNFLAKTIGRSPIWRCSLRGRDVVVARHGFRSSDEGFRRGLPSICAAHHGNVVKPLGATVSGAHIYLVYDFIRGVSLSECLHNRKNPSFTLLRTFTSRMRIASDVAQGLEYIHHHTGEKRVHGMIKSSAIILVDPTLTAKIMHFGTAELSGESSPKEASHSPQRINGTKGYMAPEYLDSGILTQKGDVYAFGVILLELLSGEEPVKYLFSGGDYVRISVIDGAREAIEGSDNGRLRRWIDQQLRDSFPADIAERATRLALDCVDVDQNRRPDMLHVAARISEWLEKSRAWEQRTMAPREFSVTMGPR